MNSRTIIASSSAGCRSGRVCNPSSRGDTPPLPHSAGPSHPCTYTAGLRRERRSRSSLRDPAARSRSGRLAEPVGAFACGGRLAGGGGGCLLGTFMVAFYEPAHRIFQGHVDWHADVELPGRGVEKLYSVDEVAGGVCEP